MNTLIYRHIYESCPVFGAVNEWKALFIYLFTITILLFSTSNKIQNLLEVLLEKQSIDYQKVMDMIKVIFTGFIVLKQY